MIPEAGFDLVVNLAGVEIRAQSRLNPHDDVSATVAGHHQVLRAGPSTGRGRVLLTGENLVVTVERRRRRPREHIEELSPVTELIEPLPGSIDVMAIRRGLEEDVFSNRQVVREIDGRSPPLHVVELTRRIAAVGVPCKIGVGEPKVRLVRCFPRADELQRESVERMRAEVVVDERLEHQLAALKARVPRAELSVYLLETLGPEVHALYDETAPVVLSPVVKVAAKRLEASVG